MSKKKKRKEVIVRNTYPLTNGQLGLTKNTVGTSFSQIHFGMALRRKKKKS
jgi:hypothetical protein